MYKIPANTLFLGKQLVFVPECHSTNTLGLQLGQNPSTVEGTTIITNKQTSGRGQRGNTWEAAPGMNLTVSIILKPGFLAVKDQFYLTIVSSLAIYDFLQGKTDLPIAIKWPNDILVQNKKICGILIENMIQGSTLATAVAGIGLNVNQMEFNVDSATSLKLLIQKETPIESVLHDVLGYLEKRYLQLRHQQYVQLKQEYLSKMYWRNELRTFASNEGTFQGAIREIDDNGKLIIETDDGLSFFSIKEIQFIE